MKFGKGLTEKENNEPKKKWGKWAKKIENNLVVIYKEQTSLKKKNTEMKTLIQTLIYMCVCIQMMFCVLHI